MALSAALALLVARPSDAATARVDVPPNCGSSAEFDAEVRRRLGDDSVLEKTQVELARQASGYQVRVQVGDEVRTLRDAECAPLFHAAVVVTVAIALSEARQRRSSVTRVVVAPVAPEPSRPEPSSEPGVSGIGASFGIGLSAGLGPNPALALELEGKAQWGLVGVAAAVRYVALSSVEDEAQRGVEVWAAGAHLAGLLRPHPILEARVGVSAYRLVGSGIGAAEPGEDAAWAAGPALGLALFPLRGRLGWLGIGGEVHFDLVRSSFEILNYGEVYAVPNPGGAAFVRAGHTFF